MARAIHEARRQAATRAWSRRIGAAPFPSQHFASGSAIRAEHIRHSGGAGETGARAEAGAIFLFCVQIENFARQLSVARFLDCWASDLLAAAIRNIVQSQFPAICACIAGHMGSKLKTADLRSRWYCILFPICLAALEWGALSGLPAADMQTDLRRWIWSVAHHPVADAGAIRSYYNEPVRRKGGVYVLRHASGDAAEVQPDGKDE